jgi:predicted TIM-barrel fold metal-dependent hydrolase
MQLAPSAEEIQARLGDSWPVPGAIDCHAHVFEPGFPLAAARAFEPHEYPLEYYLAWLRALGIRRCVLVNASCYGFDNSVTRYALEECRANGVAARGVATIHPEIGFVELQKMAAAGFVGARLMSSRVAGVCLESFEAVARRCTALRWHIEVNVDSCDEWIALEPRLARSPVPVALEYLGKDAAADSPGIEAVLRLLDRRRDFAVKVPESPELTQRVNREFPGRLMWGSHLSQSGGALDDLGLIGCVLESIPDPAMRRAVFCDNAERFYGL